MMIKLLSAEFVTSAASLSDMPPAHTDEFCVLGRSNVGKSSFINHVLGDRRLARVSRRPGKTALANLYRVSDNSTWVDLPGYGYAQAGRVEKGRWSELIRSYCRQRDALRGALWLLDIRHPGMAMDREAYEWMISIGLRFLPVLTKADKVSRNEQKAQSLSYARLFGFETSPIIYSIQDAASRERFVIGYEEWKRKPRQ